MATIITVCPKVSAGLTRFNTLVITAIIVTIRGS